MNNNLTTFYLVRHGQTDWNKEKKLQGHTDVPLNTVGEEQARELAEVLKDVQFDLAFSSDLLRTKRTAELITREKKLHIQSTEALRERMFGTLEGGPVDALLAHIAVMKTLTDSERKKYRMADIIENDDEVITRVVTFLRETAIAHPKKTILVTTHSGILRMLLLHTGYTTYAELDNLTVLNGAYIKFTSDGVDFFIDEVRGVKVREKLPESL